MQKLRSIHLYLGCIFAPQLLFFAISGIWQALGFRTPLLKLISTIHTLHVLMSGDGFSSVPLKIFALGMTWGAAQLGIGETTDYAVLTAEVQIREPAVGLLLVE